MLQTSYVELSLIYLAIVKGPFAEVFGKSPVQEHLTHC